MAFLQHVDFRLWWFFARMHLRQRKTPYTTVYGWQIGWRKKVGKDERYSLKRASFITPTTTTKHQSSFKLIRFEVFNVVLVVVAVFLVIVSGSEMCLHIRPTPFPFVNVTTQTIQRNPLQTDMIYLTYKHNFAKVLMKVVTWIEVKAN